MDFALSEEQSAIFDMAKAFGEEYIAPHAMAQKRQEQFPKTSGPKLQNGLAAYVRGNGRLWPVAVGCGLGVWRPWPCPAHRLDPFCRSSTCAAE